MTSANKSPRRLDALEKIEALVALGGRSAGTERAPGCRAPGRAARSLGRDVVVEPAVVRPDDPRRTCRTSFVPRPEARVEVAGHSYA
jgi:hypothetical protein